MGLHGLLYIYIVITWVSSLVRVRPEGGFKNRNRKPDLPKHNSGSYYRNRNIFIVLPVPVNPEPEFKIFVPVPAKPEPEIGFNRISGRIYRNSFSQKCILFKKCLLRLDMHFKQTCYILKNIFHIPVTSG